MKTTISKLLMCLKFNSISDGEIGEQTYQRI